LALAILLSYYPSVVSAAQIADRKVVIGSSVAGVSTTYSFVFTVSSSTIIKSASFTACTTASGSCITPDGFSSSSSALALQPLNIGDASGWTVNNATPGSLRIVNSGNTTAPVGSQTVTFSGVVNPNAINDTFFVKIATYSDAAWTDGIDNGVVATSTAGQVTVSVIIDEKLTFTLASTGVTLSEPSTGTTGKGVSSMTISTNAESGYSIGYTGNTLASGSNEITAMSTLAASTTNTKQFGINLASNTTPLVGSVVSGSGSGVPAADYGVQNQFKFSTSGDVIATASLPTNDNTYTTSYIVNMDGSTAAGAYSTVINYIATANF
jgi:hypothetical protein